MAAAMSFAILMIWQKPKNHVDYCYFRRVIIPGSSDKNKHKFVKPNLKLAIRAITYEDNLLVPEIP